MGSCLTKLGRCLVLGMLCLALERQASAAGDQGCGGDGDGASQLVSSLGPLSSPRVLNVACGSRRVAGATNLDVAQYCDSAGCPLVDVLADVTDMPEVPSGYYEQVVGTKLPSPIAGMKGRELAAEVHRVLAPGGTVRLTCVTPAYRAADWEAAGFHQVRIQGGGTVITAVR